MVGWVGHRTIVWRKDSARKSPLPRAWPPPSCCSRFFLLVWDFILILLFPEPSQLLRINCPPQSASAHSLQKHPSPLTRSVPGHLYHLLEAPFFPLLLLLRIQNHPAFLVTSSTGYQNFKGGLDLCTALSTPNPHHRGDPLL